MFRALRGSRNVPSHCAVHARMRDDTGMVTAELALALPVLVGVAVVLAGVLAWMALALTTHDVAHQAVRAAARGVSEADVRASVQQAIPDAEFVWTQSPESVTVSITRSVPLAGHWFPEWEFTIERTALWEMSAWNL